MGRFKRIGLVLFGLLFLMTSALVAIGAFERWRYSREPLTLFELQRSREQAVAWLMAHEGQILDDRNLVLWMMVDHSAKVSGDARLAALVARYRERWFPQGQDHYGLLNWLDDKPRWPIDLDFAADAYDYQQFLMYSVSCDQRMKSWPAVRAHLQGGACPLAPWWSLKDPACSSHQLIGLIQVQSRQCVSASDLGPTMQDTRMVVRQLSALDFRVLDAYIQRALTLWWADHGADVRPDALTRIFRAQRPDGGWNGQHVLVARPGFYLALADGPRLRTREAPSQFHTTAQAVLLADLVLRGWSRPQQALESVVAD
jgi:hypothetical protein